MSSRLLSVIVLVTLLAASGCDDDAPSTDPKPSTSASATPTPEAPATPTEDVLDPLVWQSAQHPGQPGYLERVGRGFFGTETRAVARLNAKGEDVWRYDGPATDDFSGFVVDGVPVAVPITRGSKESGGYRAHDVHALDPRTGKVRWTQRATSSYTFSDGSHVVVPTCTGAATGAVGECTLTAYDPRSGEVVWTTPTYADVERSQVGDGVAVVQTFPTADRPRFVVLDTATGAVRSTLQAAKGAYATLVGDSLVDTGPDGRPAADGCDQEVTTYDLEGEVRWQRTFELTPLADREKECESYFAFDAGGDVALGGLSGPHALLLDRRTGRTLWEDTAAGGLVSGRSGDILVVDDGQAAQSRGVDLTTGQVVWTYGDYVGGWRTEGGYATANHSCKSPESPAGSCTVVLDARTGEELLNLPGVPRTFVPGAAPGDPVGLLVRIDSGEEYAATYGFVTLPPL